MKKLPTDLEILDAIYERYYDTFASFSKGEPSRSTKIFIPIDIDSISKDMSVDADIVFGRLYYHLEQKYGYKHPGGSKVSFFTLKAGKNINCVNFPYMASVLAKLRDESKRQKTATKIAVISLCVAGVSLVISIFV